MTSFSSNASTDSVLTLFASDGTTVVETDDNDGSLGGSSSSIAGANIVSGGAYFLQVKHFSATNHLRPYHLHVRVQSGSPTAEVEPNDTPGTANALPFRRVLSILSLFAAPDLAGFPMKVLISIGPSSSLPSNTLAE